MRAGVVIGSVGVALAAAGAAAWYYFYSYTATTIQLASGGGSADTPVGDVVSTVEAAIVGWKNVGSASDWLAALAAAEQQYSLPTDLLARVAYQESHFREDIIRGLRASPAGALGMMQLEPAYYMSVNVPVPFSDSDVQAQIEDAAKEFVHLYQRFSDWKLAVAAYNAGEGNVHKYGGVPPFTETQKYVADILADVPALGVA